MIVNLYVKRPVNGENITAWRLLHQAHHEGTAYASSCRSNDTLCP
jgi:hypothetical protein